MSAPGNGRVLLTVGVVTVALVALVAALEAPARHTSTAEPVPAGSLAAGWPDSPSLVASVGTAAGVVTALPMGHVSEPLNTFWQLFVQEPSGPWHLRTPPGVATNGGILLSSAGADTGGQAITTGVLGSQLLDYSAQATSVDGGSTWTPTTFPGQLVAAPDALATAGDGEAALLVGTWRGARQVSSSGSTVFVRTAPTAPWQPLATSSTLAAALPRCGVTGPTAVAVTSSGAVVVGVSCGRAGSADLVEHTSQGWRPVGPVRSGPSTVLRLQASGSSLTALDGVSTGRGHALEAVWVDPRGAATSSPLVLAAGERVTASSLGAGVSGDVDAVAVLTSARRLVAATGGQPTWTQAPTPPPHTVGVAQVGGALEALAVSGSEFAAASWTPGAERWRLTAHRHVAIPYGSSQ